MKRFLSLLLSCLIVIQGVPAFAAGKATKFELTLSQSAKVGEALDLGVKVVGKDGEVVKDYVGTVYVTVDNDSKATIPYPDGYTFVSGDQGQKTFSKGLAFSKEGSMTVSVTDIDDDKVEWVAKVNVTAAGAATTATGTETVTLISPDDGSSVTSNEVKVTGTTKKNSKVQIFVNGTKTGETQSDDGGSFLYTAKNLSEDTNVISAKVLDGSDKVIGESAKVSVKVAASEGPAFKSIVVKEGNSVKAGSVVNVTVTAEAKLKETSIALGDTIEVLKETTDGIYMGTATVPNKTGDYPIDVTLTNSLGKKTVKTAAVTLSATEAPKPSFANVKIETSGKRATFSFQVINDSTSVSKFKFEYGTDSGALSQQAVTFEKSKILVKPEAKPVSFEFFPVAHAESGSMNDFVGAINDMTASLDGSSTGAVASGAVAAKTTTAVNPGTATVSSQKPLIPPPAKTLVSSDNSAVNVTPAKESISLAGDSTIPTYKWYIDNLTEPKYYVRITALDAAGSPISGAVSDVLEVDMSLNAAGRCTIANISGIKVTKKDDASIISWDALPEAVGYNVYKKDATGAYVLIENVKTNSYTVHIAKGDVKYEDFAIKALCSDSKTESANYAEAVKVQTGPGKLILLGLLALGIGFMVASRRKFAFLKNR